MIITKSDFDDWKKSAVTKAFFQAAEERVEDAKEILVAQAGLDGVNDNFYRGFCHAYREMMDFRVEFAEE
jgi:hypothetical protein